MKSTTESEYSLEEQSSTTIRSSLSNNLQTADSPNLAFNSKEAYPKDMPGGESIHKVKILGIDLLISRQEELSDIDDDDGDGSSSHSDSERSFLVEDIDKLLGIKDSFRLTKMRLPHQNKEERLRT